MTSCPLLASALAHHLAGRRAAAEAACRSLLQTDPRHFGALHLLAVMAHAQRRLPVAEKLLRLALSSPFRPKTAEQHLESLNLLGAVLADFGRAGDAAEVFRQACDLRPGDPALWRNLGKAHWLGGDLEAAVEAYERAIDAATKARRLRHNAETDRTVRGHDAGAPGESPVAPRGGKPAPARTNDSSLEGLFADLISLHHARLDTKAAIAVRRRLVALVPDNATARSDLLLSLHYRPDLSAKELFEEHVAAGARMRPLDGTHQPPPLTSSLMLSGARSCRIAYLSGDFREYPMTRFLAPVLAAHDRSACEIILYSDTTRPDAVTDLLAQRCDRFIDVSALADSELDRRLREEHLDLLVDLSGHMENRRIAVLAGKPARRIASYINYPNTLGLSAIDFRLTDALCDPPGEADAFHVERLVRLDSCAWAYDPMFGLDGPEPAVGPLPAGDNGFVTFGVLARPTKLIPEAARLWAGVLEAVPAARLAILQAPGIDARRLKAFLGACGIEANRVVLLEPGPRRHYLELHQRIDILLDTWPYNGMTGTCDALWMGVPVVTLAGDRHVSRVGASLLAAVGLPQLVNTTSEAYVTAAAMLASSLDRLALLRSTLRDRFNRSPLQSGERIARVLEALGKGA